MSVAICARNYLALELTCDDDSAARSHSAAVDSWSFGRAFYELLSGELFAPERNFFALGAPAARSHGHRVGHQSRSSAAVSEPFRKRHPGVGKFDQAEPWLSHALAREAKTRMGAKTPSTLDEAQGPRDASISSGDDGLGGPWRRRGSLGLDSDASAALAAASQTRPSPVASALSPRDSDRLAKLQSDWRKAAVEGFPGG